MTVNSVSPPHANRAMARTTPEGGRHRGCIGAGLSKSGDQRRFPLPSGECRRNMSKHFFRAIRDFSIVHLPLSIRAFAIFLIFTLPVLAALYFHTALDEFNKKMNSIPSFTLLALSGIIFYTLRYYLDYDKFVREPGSEIYFQEYLPLHVRILLGIAILLLIIGVIISPQPL
jgi:hypothetical protein